MTRPRGSDCLEDEAETLQFSDEKSAAESHGMDFISSPIPDGNIPATLQPTLDVIDKILHALNHGKNVSVHCRQGGGRSSRRIVTQTRAIPAPETAAQMDWLRQLTPVSNYP